MPPIDTATANPTDANGDRFETLIIRAKTGSDSALGDALTECRPALIQVAQHAVRRGLRPIVGASDIVQDTFVNATKAIRNFRGKRAVEFLSWLRAILRRRVAEIARKRGSSGEGAPEPATPRAAVMSKDKRQDEGPSPSGIVMQEESTGQIRAGLARLSERDRTVLNLRFNDGLTFPQIGTKLCTSEDAARMLFSRAVERLRRELHLEGTNANDCRAD